jgi:hypothetical protein
MLEVPYWTLTELAGHGRRIETSAGRPPGHAGGGDRGVTGEPTNAELARLLEAIRAELGALREGQDGLVRAVTALGPDGG